MLFTGQALEGFESGVLGLAFRRWDRPRVRAGTRMRTRIGVLEVDSVAEVSASVISGEDARRAGFAGREELIEELARRGRGRIYRVELHLAGPDPRVELRERDALSATDVAEIDARLARMDTASRSGPWTMQVLELIEARPGVRAADLAASLGSEKPPFKRRVRGLKELGLTESLEVGYRLSPRGRAYLARARSG
jgi:hypothetical protein